MIKTILISNHSLIEETKQCKLVLKMLSSMGYQSDLCLIKYKHPLDFESYDVISFDCIDTLFYDIIFLFNYNNFNKFKQTNKPIIWIDNLEDQKRLMNGIRHHKLVDVIFFVDNGMHKDLLNFLPQSFFKTIILLPSTNDFHSIKSKNKSKKILVDINADNHSNIQLYSIISALNQLSWLSIDIRTNHSFKSIVNSNIHIINKIVNNELIEYSLVIANKMTAATAVLSGVKCIVIGEKGYGGIVNKENIEQLYNSNFNGRTGGYIGETIPLKLLIKDIVTVTKSNETKNYHNKINNILHNFQSKQTENLKTYIDAMMNNYYTQKMDIQSAVIKFNFFYQISQSNEKEWAIKDTFGKFQFNIGKNEYLLISEFKKPTQVKEAIEKLGFINNSDVAISFIKELLKNKILIGHLK